jgi:hypothetical protein
MTCVVLGVLLSLDVAAAPTPPPTVGDLIVNCPTGTSYTALIAPNATISSLIKGICYSCVLEQPYNIVDSDLLDNATMLIPAGVSGSVVATLEDTSTTYPAGEKAGFIINKGDAQELLTVAALQNLRLITLLNGVQQEATGSATPLVLDVADTTTDNTKYFVSLKTSKPFNALQMQFGGLANVLNALNIYSGGVCAAQ